MKTIIAIIVIAFVIIGCKRAIPKRKTVEDKVIDLYLKIVCGDGKPADTTKPKKINHDTAVQKSH